MCNSKYVKWMNDLTRRLGIIFVATVLSFGALAQTSSADSAIVIAQQWLDVADVDPAMMWEKSDPLMKEKVDRTFWINYIATKKIPWG